jgi:hypothetical protein
MGIGGNFKGAAVGIVAMLAAACVGDSEASDDLAAASDTSGDASSDTGDDDGIGSDGGRDDDGSDDGAGTTGAPADDGADDPGGDPPPPKLVRVHPGATEEAELVQTLPVGDSEGAADRKVVLRLTPSQLPDLQVGDVLTTPTEVQVTTRCDIGQVAPGCDYNPKVRAQIILTGNPEDDAPGGAESIAIGEPLTLTCTKNEHHCMFVFRPDQATRVIESALPCMADDTCRVNVVLWAWDSQARPGGQDKVLVGGNEGNYLANGIVEGDVARLMVIRERGIDAADRHARETSGGGNVVVPTTTAPTLLFSHPLKAGDAGLKAGEQYVVEAKIPTTVGSRARFSSKMYLTTDPNDDDGGSVDGVTPKAIGEHNGINCLPGETCITRKVAVFTVTEDVPGPVYVNIYAKSAIPGGGSTTVTVHRGDGWLRSTRYDPEHEG